MCITFTRGNRFSKAFCIICNKIIRFTYLYFEHNIGEYDETTGKLLNNTQDLRCTDSSNFCTNVAWTNLSWANGNIPYLNMNPPMKDTIVVPTGKVNNSYFLIWRRFQNYLNKVIMLYKFT